jgi:hypothetical protein
MPRPETPPDSCAAPSKQLVFASAAAKELGTTWGPHAMHTVGQLPRRRTDRSPILTGLISGNAYSHVLGVKGSPVQIRPSRPCLAGQKGFRI